MMSLGLVDYGSSDESNTEEENDVVSKRERDAIDNNAGCEKASVNINDKPHNINNSSTNKGESSVRNSFCSEVLNSDEINEQDDTFNNIENDVRKQQDNKLFSLPTPKINKLHDIDFDWSRLSSKKPNQAIKILVPSLNDLDTEENSEPVKKKTKPSKAGSGLFALLPSPKNTFGKPGNSLQPQQIKNKPKTLPVKKSDTPKIGRHPMQSTSSQLKNDTLLSSNYDSPDESEENESSSKIDFFSLSSSVDVPASEIQVPENVDKYMYVTDKLINEPSRNKYGTVVSGNENKFTEVPSTFLKTQATTHFNSGIPDERSTFVNEDYSVGMERQAQRDLQLDETALQQLCGRRERHGGPSVELIDVSGDAILPDAREWMTKQLTEEQSTSIHSHKKRDGPTTQQRRKHQITYLAFQAKEHELELKNQWANNRMSRKQTQAKYGF